ncbi:hypothetical protein [Nocardia sp. NPDC004750]
MAIGRIAREHRLRNARWQAYVETDHIISCGPWNTVQNAIGWVAGLAAGPGRDSARPLSRTGARACTCCSGETRLSNGVTRALARVLNDLKRLTSKGMEAWRDTEENVTGLVRRDVDEKVHLDQHGGHEVDEAGQGLRAPEHAGTPPGEANSPQRYGPFQNETAPAQMWFGDSKIELTPGRPVAFGRGDIDPDGRWPRRYQDVAPRHVTFGVEPDGRVWLEDHGTPGGTEIVRRGIAPPGRRVHLDGHESILLGQDFVASPSIFHPLPAATLPDHVARGRDLLADLDPVPVAGMLRPDLPVDPGLAEIARLQRFDELPTVVDPDHIDAVVASGGREFFRGVTDPAHVEDFKSGAYFAGKPAEGIISGNGIYVTDREVAALEYAKGRPEGVIRMALRPGAHTIHARDLYLEQQAVLHEFRNELSQLKAQPQTSDVADKIASVQAQLAVLSDQGRYAAVRGYDAYMTNGGFMQHKADYWVVLNRSALVVQR